MCASLIVILPAAEVGAAKVGRCLVYTSGWNIAFSSQKWSTLLVYFDTKVVNISFTVFLVLYVNSQI